MSSRHVHFLLFGAPRSGNYFRGTPARSGLTWVIVSQNSSSTFSFDSPTTSTFGTPASTRRTLREPVGLVAVEVDPFDAVAVTAARRHHVHRRHRRPRLRWGGFNVPAPDGRVRQPVPDIAGGNRNRSKARFPCGHHCERKSIPYG
jgi:hypothetical protein